MSKTTETKRTGHPYFYQQAGLELLGGETIFGLTETGFAPGPVKTAKLARRFSCEGLAGEAPKGLRKWYVWLH